MEMEGGEGIVDTSLNAQIETAVAIQTKHRNNHLQTPKQK
jgi:hypothetical protein